jgi:hypothetical protein
MESGQGRRDQEMRKLTLPAGSRWFTERSAGKIGRLGPSAADQP